MRFKYSRVFTAAMFVMAVVSCSDSPSGPSGPSGPPFTITASPSALTLAQGTSATLALTLTRARGFTGEVQLSGLNLPSGIVIPGTVIPAGSTTSNVTIAVALDATPGVATLKLRADTTGGAVDTTSVVVTITQTVATVEIQVAKNPVAYDDTTNVVAIVRSADGSIVNGRTVLWSTADTAIHRFVSASGASTRLIGWGEGQAFIFARVDSLTATTIVTVGQAPVHEVVVTAPRDTLEITEEMQLSAVPRDSRGRTLNRLINWASTNGNVLSVDVFGRVRAIGAGTAEITATAVGTVGRISVVVPQPPLQGVRISPDILNIDVGQTFTFAGEVYDIRGQTVPGRTIRWRVGVPTVASIDAVTGTLNALSAGPTVVEAYVLDAPEITGTAQVYVKDPTPAGFTIATAASSLTIPFGGYASMDVTVTRTGWFDGPVTIVVDQSGLPDGLSARQSTTIPAGETTRSVLFWTPAREADYGSPSATVTVRGIAGLGYPDATTPLDITVGPSPPAKTVEECRSYWQPILAGNWTVRDLYNYTYAPEPATWTFAFTPTSDSEGTLISRRTLSSGTVQEETGRFIYSYRGDTYGCQIRHVDTTHDWSLMSYSNGQLVLFDAKSGIDYDEVGTLTLIRQ